MVSLHEHVISRYLASSHRPGCDKAIVAQYMLAHGDALAVVYTKQDT